ncbi:UcrQ [Lasiodiplodia theobromae]|uniref:Cytochrome b-c1 complex subunit 8 n=2 Tax=Lasiodiplodia TaxID=66739 RepID=A0A5N5DTW0_9PEZI|nr:Ubiquinol-cytochrome c reductase subunit 8 [Lasiodiplodia theobromae]KAB2581140.1 Cytochrome b-c1 complex subunit 8 [Lasiodiplodia theobromae]KAF4539960.1 Ubiquinol-cytochrome c reductase subunit 8 [Lasiodiplodia theobromae]KAF9629426.1 UcrQ [Lasiodiplodia theobromae]KAK0664234.1 Cytochrome b-c1 complex subunit 8 [Lasiodiplodia hormozganensis]
MGGGGEKLPGQYMGWWGSLGSLPQKGVTTYALSQNRQKPLGGAFNAAIFNTFRRTRQQILFWAPPMIAGYSIMQWAIESNEYYNGKEGRALMGGDEE